MPKILDNEQWCIDNCTKGFHYHVLLGMVNNDNNQCARCTCKPFADWCNKQNERKQ